MASGDGKSLWATPDRARHFLIPDEAELAEGDLELRDLRGRPRKVDAAAAAQFEISADEAHARIRASLSEVFAGVKQVVGDLMARGAAVASAPANEKVQKDVAELKQGLRTLWNDVVDAARGATASATDEKDQPAEGAAMAEKLKQLLGSPELEQLVRGAAAGLQSIADDLNRRREGDNVIPIDRNKPKD